MVDAKLLIFNVNGDSLRGPLIIGTFEKRAPATLNFEDWKSGWTPYVYYTTVYSL